MTPFVLNDDNPTDYLWDELHSLVGPSRLHLGQCASLIVLLRSLLRARRVAWRAATVIPSRSMRGLAGVYLREWNPRLIQLKAQFVLETLSQLIHSVSTLIRFCIEAKDTPELPDGNRVEEEWGRVASELGNRNLNDGLFLTVDLDDVFARLAEFYFGRQYSPAPEALGKMILDFYRRTPRAEDDVITPEKLAPERPLTDTVYDLWALLECMSKRESLVLDYGAGVGRTRHYFYALGLPKNTVQPRARAPERIHYVSVETADAQARLRTWPGYPNGPHLTEEFGYPCCCEESSHGDSLVIINPLIKDTIVDAFSMVVVDGRDIWHSRIQKEWAGPADVALLVNVLHEVRYDGLQVLLENLRKVVRIGGVVLIYEMLGLTTVEQSYVIWYPEDIRDLFSVFGFHVVAVPGRIRNPENGSWGFPYLLACLLRAGSGESQHGEPALRKLWKSRADRLVRRVNMIAARLRGGNGTDADRFEHFHAVQSLVNALRQSEQGA